MLPYASLLLLQPTSTTPLYLQLSEQLGQLIRAGTLVAGQRLPGSRQLASQLAINRLTVVAAYDDLLTQGWLESWPGSGTYVATHLPAQTPHPLNNVPRTQPTPMAATAPGYALATRTYLNVPVMVSPAELRFDDGLPDARLAPLHELSRAYRAYSRWGNPQAHFGYATTYGHPMLRHQLANYLNETRGLNTTPDNILITRGSVMGMHLVAQTLLGPGDTLVASEATWASAIMNARQAGADVLTLPADQHGLDVEALASVCASQPIRLVYITPHHNYPTTVTLRADRRLRLLQLAEQYRFAILEDDYDYDFHYLGRPILPLASADRQGMVIYVGSLTKSIAPAFRVGYVVGPTALIDELARLRRIIDRQGDPPLEFAIGQLFETGELRRHFRKALRTYLSRRDHLCDLLTTHLPDQVRFTKPDGGMAIWATFSPEIDLSALSTRAKQAGLYLPARALGATTNSLRMGFASSTEAEHTQAVAVLKQCLS
jgi:GntR family transcriptional regulator / MocR family aminotransferase